jgi:hypothetical protein
LFFSIDDKPYNKTYAEWAAWWWQKHISIPDKFDEHKTSLYHPRNHYSTDKCNLAQDGGPVWFLPDGKEKPIWEPTEYRTCIVPEGKSIMVQIVGSGCSTGEGWKTEKELKNCADWIFKNNKVFTNLYHFRVAFDGIEIMNSIVNPSDKEKFYVEACRTNLTYSFPNTYIEKGSYPYIKDFTNDIASYCNSNDTGVFNATVSGTFFLSKPLKAGNHTLAIYESASEKEDQIILNKRESNYIYNIQVRDNLDG